MYGYGAGTDKVGLVSNQNSCTLSKVSCYKTIPKDLHMMKNPAVGKTDIVREREYGGRGRL